MWSFYSPNPAFRTEFLFLGRGIAYKRKRTKDEIKAKIKVHPQRLRGLTKVLPGLLYPTANYMEAALLSRISTAQREQTLGVTQKDLIPHLGEGKHDHGKFTVKDTYGSDGQKRGRIVDQHVCAIMNGTIIKDKPTYSIHPRLAPQLSKVGGIEATPQKLGHVHPLAQMFLLEMLDRGYRPKAAMVPVGSLELMVGTLMDPIFEHVETGKLVATELKVWNPAHFTDGNDVMQPPYNDHDNSPYNTSMLQLGMSVLFFEKTFGYRPAQAWLVPVYFPTDPLELDPQKCVRVFELESWVLEPKRIERFMDACTRLRRLIHLTSAKQKERHKLRRAMEKRKKEREEAEEEALDDDDDGKKKKKKKKPKRKRKRSDSAKSTGTKKSQKKKKKIGRRASPE